MSLETLLAQTTRKAPPVPMRVPRNLTSASPGAGCLRCGGLLVLSYMASLERDFSGRPMRLWRCVNCGDCIDRDILANRWKGSVPARETADSPAHIVFPQPVTNGVHEGRRRKTDEATQPAITVTRNHVPASPVCSHERSSHHG